MHQTRRATRAREGAWATACRVIGRLFSVSFAIESGPCFSVPSLPTSSRRVTSPSAANTGADVTRSHPSTLLPRRNFALSFVCPSQPPSFIAKGRIARSLERDSWAESGDSVTFSKRTSRRRPSSSNVTSVVSSVRVCSTSFSIRLRDASGRRESAQARCDRNGEVEGHALVRLLPSQPFRGRAFVGTNLDR
jgi:hypothetical protein